MRALAILLSLFACIACGETKNYDSALDKVLDTKELVVGTEPEFKPFESKDADGNYVGFDMDMIRLLAEDLGVKLRIEEMNFTALVPAIETHKIDMIISGMTATEERAQKVTFSDIYYETPICLLVHKDSGINRPADADGKRLVVKQGTTGQTLAKKKFPKSKGKITVMQSEGECATEVALGRADAFVYDKLSVVGAQKKHAKTTRAVLEPPVNIEGYAMAVRHGDAKMVTRVNEFLAKIRADGRFKKLQDTYLRELLDAAK
ncbi:MAG: transporter substrate-binding domain-containing protein [Planctomycetota bacterium]|jgi:polar amino acid transport system substrate-binding protein